MRERPVDTQHGPNRPGTVLAMLLVVYIFSWIDRQILGILATPIKLDLHLSDTQLGLIGGLAFAILYASLSVPAAWLADRTSRTWVITVSLMLWSLFTALCGTAVGFLQLFLSRIGVGIGEAGGVAPSYAVIADSFPLQHRAKAMSVYSLGIPLGSATGALLGAGIASTLNWRAAFLIAGCSGLLLAMIFRLVVREPGRTTFSVLTGNDPAWRARSLWSPSLWLLYGGAATASTLSYGYAFWLPSLLQRSYHLDLATTSVAMAVFYLFGGGSGVMLGGWLADRLGPLRRGAYALVPAAALLLIVPVTAAALLTHLTSMTMLLLGMSQALALMWLGPIITAVQQVAPAHKRAIAASIFVLLNNLIGLTIGNYVIGLMSDHWTARFGPDALRIAMVAVLPGYAVAALFMIGAARLLDRDGAP